MSKIISFEEILRCAYLMCGKTVSEEDIKLSILVYEKVRERGVDFSIDDASEIIAITSTNYETR